MPIRKAKPKTRAKKTVRGTGKPVFVCHACGLEVTVTGGVAEASTLVCCDQAMKAKK